jgi:hypothetical protein
MQPNDKIYIVLWDFGGNIVVLEGAKAEWVAKTGE